MFSRKIQFLNQLLFKGEKLTQEQFEELNAALAQEEQLTLGHLADQLEGCEGISAMLDCADISVDEFVESAHIDYATVDKCKDRFSTSFEKDIFIYLICRYIYEQDRTHCCQMCLTPFYGYYERDCLCDNCLGRLLLWMDRGEYPVK